jgi:hypothetical protein
MALKSQQFHKVFALPFTAIRKTHNGPKGRYYSAQGASPGYQLAKTPAA